MSLDKKAFWVPIKHYPTINWNVRWRAYFTAQFRVPIKHYPTINWNIQTGLSLVVHKWFQLNTIQRLTET